MTNHPSPGPRQAPVPKTSRRGGSAGWSAAGAGGTLAACLVLGLGLAAFLLSARMAARQATATEPEPVRQGGDETPSGKPYPVGFRKTMFTYRPTDGSARQRQVLLWYPATGVDRPFDYGGQKGYATPDAPVAPAAHALILFSHGFLGSADQTIFLMEAFARAGYIVAAVNHADAGNRKRSTPMAWPNFFDAKAWDDTKCRDRRDDLVALLDHLLELDASKDSFLYHHVDRKAIGAAGHSLGGYTILGMIGGRPSWREPRLRAALLLSPYAMPYLRGTTLGSIKTPVMLQGGTLDLGITPLLKAVYTPLPGPKYYLVLKNETHFAWTNLMSLGQTTTECVKQGNAKRITDYSLAFFDHHLRGEAEPLLQSKGEGLDSYRYKDEPER